jgi:signal transduction histidine kinase
MGVLGQCQDYLAESSHELRIPIAGIQASAETLLCANPSCSTRKELIEQILRQGHRVAAARRSAR